MREEELCETSGPKNDPRRRFGILTGVPRHDSGEEMKGVPLEKVGCRNLR